MVVELTRRDGSTGVSRTDSGVSIVEALFAFLILLVVILGIIPLFGRAMTSNAAGRESTNLANYARSRAEDLFQRPFNSADLTIQAGTERQHFEIYRNDAWEVASDLDPPLAAGTEWTRQSTIRQYNVADLEDPLPAGSDPGQIHVKEIEVVVRNARLGGILGAGRSLGVRLYKAQ